MMDCKETQQLLDAGLEIPALAREHLGRCPSCRSYAENERLLREGFKALAQEPVPELSVGFSARLLRRLEQTAGRMDPARDFLERAGKRVVYAGLVLAM